MFAGSRVADHCSVCDICLETWWWPTRTYGSSDLRKVRMRGLIMYLIYTFVYKCHMVSTASEIVAENSVLFMKAFLNLYYCMCYYVSVLIELFYSVTQGEITDMGSEHYCLRWNNHQSNLLGVFSQLLQDESLVDVTLACAEGHSIRAHKVVLSACSSYFQTLFVDHPNRHPIVILKDVRFAELRTLVEFMYKGEVNVEYCQLSALLKTAESLKVKGLAEMTNLNSAREDRGEGHQQQQPKHSASSINVPDTPMTTEVAATTRLMNEDIDTPPPGGSLSPPQSKRASQVRHGSGCDDNDSCDEGGTGRVETPDVDDLSPVHDGCAGPSDMSVTTNATTSCNPPPTAVTATCSTATSRLPSPHSSEPMPGPSGMLPVQQVPLVSIPKIYTW